MKKNLKIEYYYENEKGKENKINMKNDIFEDAKRDALEFIDIETDFQEEQTEQNKKFYKKARALILKKYRTYKEEERRAYLSGLQFYGLTAGRYHGGEPYVVYIDSFEE